MDGRQLRGNIQLGVDRDGYGVSVLNGIGGVGYGTKLTFQSTALYAGNARWITDER